MPALSLLIDSLERTPQQLEEIFRLVPPQYCHWTPASWGGIPGEMFAAAGQACHLRDIEVDGYHVRIRRMLDEEHPDLLSLDSYEIARAKGYLQADPHAALADFRRAREATIELVRTISPQQFERVGTFAEYGQLTLGGLIHYLCSHDQQHLACMQWLLGKIESDSRDVGARGTAAG